MFGTLGGPEIFLILVIALIVFGPRRLPEIGKTMGRMLGEFRRASNDFKRTLEEEVESEKTRTTTPPATEAVTPSTVAPPAPAAPDGAPSQPMSYEDAYESATVTAADMPAGSTEPPASDSEPPVSAAPDTGPAADAGTPSGEPGTVSRPDSRPIEPR
jgi:Tat protein translocase TatB subunit